MGACSSKPKTTEFEGSMEPRKPTDVAAEQPHETERSLENLVDDHGNDAPVQAGEEGEDAHASVEGVETKPVLDASKDEGPGKEVLSRSAESTSEAKSDVLGEKEAVDKEAIAEVEQKESKVDGVSDEFVQKDDVDGGGVADSASVKRKGADNKEASVVDEAKTCEDKAVVSEEAGIGQGDGAYVDKTVALDEEKVPETPEKRSIIVPEEEVITVLDSAESAGVESPIIGVVRPIEPINKDDASKIVASEADIVAAHEGSQDNSKLVAESSVTGAGDVDADVIATEDALKDVPAPAREVSSEDIEARGVEILASTVAVEALAPVSALETLAPAEADPLKDGKESTPHSQEEAPATAVADVSPAAMDSKSDVEACSTDAKVSGPFEESVVNQYEEPHTSTNGNGGSVDILETETPKPIKNSDSEVAPIESKAKDAEEESVEEKGGPMVEEKDVSNGQTQALAMEEEDKEGRPTITLGESIPEREERNKQIQESTTEVGKDTADKPHVDDTSSGDAAFEDASDAPLKLEASKSIESDRVPS